MASLWLLLCAYILDAVDDYYNIVLSKFNCINSGKTMLSLHQTATHASQQQSGAPFRGPNGSCHHWMCVAAEYPSVGVKTLASHMIICIAISINGMNGNAIFIYIYIYIHCCNQTWQRTILYKWRCRSLAKSSKRLNRGQWLGSPVMFGGQKSSEVFCKPSFKPVCLEIPIKPHFFLHFVDEIFVFWLVKTYYSQAT